MRTYNLQKVEQAFEWLQKEFENIDVLQSLDVLINQSNALNSVITWAYEQMAIAKKELNEKKALAYIELNGRSVSQKQLYSPSLAKDYINSVCSEENYRFDIVERLCRSCVHVSDNLRTSISAMKEQVRMDRYNETVL